LLDVLNSDHLRLHNMTGNYNSAFLNNIYPGIRFPGTSYNDVSLQNITLNDTAVSTVHAPIVLARPECQHGTVLKDVIVTLKAWNGDKTALLPGDIGAESRGDIEITYEIGASKLIFKTTGDFQTKGLQPLARSHLP
jgi:hypothetical protein